jgi:hypothetical protein
MSPEKTEALFKSFPGLYAGYSLPPTQTLMCFGFECDDGWFDLLWRLSKNLSEEHVVAVQVKEKYGTLRFYIGVGSDTAFDIVDTAEAESACICEKCGDAGEMRTRGIWLKVLCEGCNNIWQKY